MQRDGAFDTPLDAGGRRYLVRSSFDLVRRIESAFGPLRDFSRRVATQSVTAAELADLYGIALADDPRVPAREDVEAHVMRVGIVRAAGAVLPLLLNLFAGNEKAAEWISEELARRETDDDDILEGSPRPHLAA